MKHLFNDISSEEKNRILEMHKRAVDSEMINENQSQDMAKNENSKIKKPVLDFVRLMELNQLKLIKFGQQDFKEKPTSANTIAKNIVVNNATIPGLQLYRGIPKVRQFKDMYVYIWLDSRDLTTKPFVNLIFNDEYKKFDLSTQFNEIKSYVDNNIVKHY